MESLLQQADIQTLADQYILPWGINVALALAILLFGRWASKLVLRFARQLLARSTDDPMLINFLSALLNAVLMVVVVVAALDQLGVATTSIVAVLGAAGIAIGLALQGSLQNFAAGIMLMIFRPFRIGDYVEAGGTAGTVEKVGIFSTTMTSADNKEVIVPNSNVYKDTIVNYSAKPIRRIDLIIGIGYESDLARAKSLLQSIINAESRVLTDPTVRIGVSELADSSVNIIVRPWVKTDDYLSVKCDLLEAIKLRFDQEGIEIPYPKMDVHYTPQVPALESTAQ